MKCIQAEWDKDTDKITVREDAKTEDWITVCQKFNDDVERLRDVTDIDEYTALYECFDSQNTRFFYLVKEDQNLYKIRRKRFLKNIGIK